MTDVFISYKREEREQARQLAEALTARGYSVWWDAEILPGEQYRAVTLQILESCCAALVIWSPRSTNSGWVLDEAQRALDRGVLVPVHLEDIKAYPLGFGQLHAHNLVGWNGAADDAKFQPVLAAVERLVAVQRASAKSEQAPENPEAEIAFWRGVQDSRDPHDLQAYLNRYGEGMFAELAQRKLAALKASAPKIVAQEQAAPSVRPLGGFEPTRDAPKASAPQTAPPSALGAGFTRWEIAFVAVVVFVAGFVLWPIGNVITSTRMIYVPDYTSMFAFGYSQNVYVMTPLLTALAWGYDRAAAWCAGQSSAWMQRAPLILAPALLVLLAILAILERNEYADEEAYFMAAEKMHLYLWLAAAWGAAVYARKLTPHFKRLLERMPLFRKG